MHVELAGTSKVLDVILEAVTQIQTLFSRFQTPSCVLRSYHTSVRGRFLPSRFLPERNLWLLLTFIFNSVGFSFLTLHIGPMPIIFSDVFRLRKIRFQIPE